MLKWYVALYLSPFSDSCASDVIECQCSNVQTKILSKDDTESNLKVAYGVQIDGENICINEKNRGEIVISGGAVNSPHLLMLSGIGDAEELQQHGIDITCPVPGVGMVTFIHYVFSVTPS